MKPRIRHTFFVLLSASLLGGGYYIWQGQKSAEDALDQIKIPKTIIITTTGSTENTGDLLSGNQFSGLSDSQIFDKLITTLPVCKSVPEKNADIIDIDGVVKNCTEKKKEGIRASGLGGACFDSYIYTNKLVAIHPCNNRDNFKYNNTQEYVCSQQTNVFGGILNTTVQGINNSTPERLVSEIAIRGMKQALEGGYLSEIAPSYSTSLVYCAENDTDCIDMYDQGGRSDNNGNYFAAGVRSENKKQTLYVINNKVYHPGSPSTNWYSLTPKDTGSSQWLFAGVKNNKIIVKKMKTYKVTNQQIGTTDSVKSTYTLQTCEIDQ